MKEELSITAVFRRLRIDDNICSEQLATSLSPEPAEREALICPKLRYVQCRLSLRILDYNSFHYLFCGCKFRCLKTIFKAVHRKLSGIELFFKSVIVNHQDEIIQHAVIDVDGMHCD